MGIFSSVPFPEVTLRPRYFAMPSSEQIADDRLRFLEGTLTREEIEDIADQHYAWMLIKDTVDHWLDKTQTKFYGFHQLFRAQKRSGKIALNHMAESGLSVRAAEDGMFQVLFGSSDAVDAFCQRPMWHTVDHHFPSCSLAAVYRFLVINGSGKCKCPRIATLNEGYTLETFLIARGFCVERDRCEYTVTTDKSDDGTVAETNRMLARFDLAVRMP